MKKKKVYNPTSVPPPGATLAEKLEEIGMDTAEFATLSGNTENTIAAVLKGKAPITPEMAVQFEGVVKIPAHFWLNRQRRFDMLERIKKAKRKGAVLTI